MSLCPVEVDLPMRPWEGIHCKGSNLLTEVSSAVTTHGHTGQTLRRCLVMAAKALHFLKAHSEKQGVSKKSPGCQSHPLDWGHVAGQSRHRKDSSLDFPGVGGRAHVLPVPEEAEGREAINLPGRTWRPPVQPG